jgi:hypothetical protein
MTAHTKSRDEGSVCVPAPITVTPFFDGPDLYGIADIPAAVC